eukprot:TRINITY_DN1650_c0_g1_i3.p1 TRINITY_DN1650_c0_g1~~TRINITY_DN1650_c0_g1_i3.p1  ORF type:complete len:104 (+),score=23.10 TRINITY_DN1650_c0_g1_i3:662-973(+)
MGKQGFCDGKQQSLFNKPMGICCDDKNGSLFICDSRNHAIRQINIVTGEVSTIAGKGGQGEGYLDGVGIDAIFNLPQDICMGKNGQLFVTDVKNKAIRLLTPT